MAPTSVSSRFNASPTTPLPKSSISFSMASVRPSIFATPSPISRTTPTFWRATEVLMPEICASISCSKLLINQSVGFQFKNASRRFSKRARTLPSCTSPSTLIRRLPSSAGFLVKDNIQTYAILAAPGLLSPRPVASVESAPAFSSPREAVRRSISTRLVVLQLRQNADVAALAFAP